MNTAIKALIKEAVREAVREGTTIRWTYSGGDAIGTPGLPASGAYYLVNIRGYQRYEAMFFKTGSTAAPESLGVFPHRQDAINACDAHAYKHNPEAVREGQVGKNTVRDALELAGRVYLEIAPHVGRLEQAAIALEELKIELQQGMTGFPRGDSGAVSNGMHDISRAASELSAAQRSLRKAEDGLKRAFASMQR